MAHLLALAGGRPAVATELAVNETSPPRPEQTPTGTRAAARSSTPRSTHAGRRSRWPSCASVSRRSRRAPRLPDGRPREPLAEARPTTSVLPRRNHRALRGARGGPQGDPRGGRPVTLRDLLVDAVGQLDDVEAALTPDGAIAWSRVGRAFSILAADGASAEFGLDPAVAAAAARTPDVEPSSRGAGWITFAPGRVGRPRRGPRGRLARIRPSPARSARLTSGIQTTPVGDRGRGVERARQSAATGVNS